MKGYIDFIESVSTNNNLGGEFIKLLNKISPVELSSWFSVKGFNVSVNECTMVLDRKNYINDSLKILVYLVY